MPAAGFARVLRSIALSENGGRRECRVFGAPAAARALPAWGVRATSALPSIATGQQTSRIGGFVPRAAVAAVGPLVRRSHARTCGSLSKHSVALGDHRLNADLVRVTMSGDPNKCGAIEPEIMYSPRMVSDTSVRTWVTGVAIGNVVSENQGRIERGQSAEIDFRSGGVVVRP